jgi:isopentenyl diphosphate isomerase/L-lactate dehydrogenase-like FMN-dependent dehydrogenase
MPNYRLKLYDDSLPISVAEWRAAARRKLPELAWAYLEGGADDLVARDANMTSFRQWRLRQRILTGISSPDLSASVAKTQLRLPLALAPTGASGLSHRQGDIAAGRAAEKAGVRMVLSTAASFTLEEVARATEQAHWFQLYPFGNHARVAALMKRAKEAGYTAMFVTVDVPVLGNREAERRSGMTLPWTLTPRRVMDMVRHIGWLRDVLRHDRVAAIHYLEPQPDGGAPPDPLRALRSGSITAVDNAARSAAELARYMQGDLRWEDLAWMRDHWQGPFYVKGILDPEDAARAVDSIGADGVVVSNHGGRQLGCAVASVDALAAIVDRVGDRAEVYLDGGVRRGTDVLTALCLGARGVFIGRPYLYGLAAAGETGVSSILEIFRSEIQRALILMGCPSVQALDRSWLAPAPRCGASSQPS